MPLKLTVNLNTIAALRAMRPAGAPDPVVAAGICMAAGADMISACLSRSRKPLNEEDMLLLHKMLGQNFCLEMTPCSENEKFALKLRAAQVCLVPEPPTKGGLRVLRRAAELEKIISQLSRAHISAAVYIEPDAKEIRAAHKIGAEGVMLSARAYAASDGKTRAAELENLQVAAILSRELRLRLHARGGLDYANVSPVAAIDGIECLNVGFAIAARASLYGLANAVAEMRRVLSQCAAS